MLQQFSAVCALGDLEEAERIFKEEPLCLQVKAYKYDLFKITLFSGSIIFLFQILNIKDNVPI